MNHSPEKQCNMCGNAYFSKETHPCPRPGCTGTMCRVITPLPGKRVSGVLYRDIECSDNIWLYDEIGGATHSRTWNTKEWKAQYGKLPRKGSKSMVIIELVSNGK